MEGPQIVSFQTSSKFHINVPNITIQYYKLSDYSLEANSASPIQPISSKLREITVIVELNPIQTGLLF